MMGRSPPWHCVWLARHLLAWASRPVAHVHHHSCCCSRTSSSSVDVVRLRFIEPASCPCTAAAGTGSQPAVRRGLVSGCQHARGGAGRAARAPPLDGGGVKKGGGGLRKGMGQSKATVAVAPPHE